MTSPARAPRPTPRRQDSPIRERSSRPDLRVVGPPVRRPHATRAFAFTVVIVFGALLASAVAHSLLVSGQAHLDQVDAQVRVEQDRLQRERLRLANFQSPDRIAREARALGMVPANDQVWVVPSADEPADPGDTAGATSNDQLATDAPARPGGAR